MIIEFSERSAETAGDTSAAPAKPEKSRWYAVRAKPGTQKTARPLPVSADASEMFKLEIERRKGESIIERQLRNEGVDVYMPSFHLMLRHHRTNKLIDRRLPLLVGYCFVHLPNQEFERVRGVDAVMCMLAPSRKAGPVVFPEVIISRLMLAEFEVEQAKKLQSMVNMEQKRFRKANELRGQLKKILPAGRHSKTSMRDYAQESINRLSDVARNRVLSIIKQLDALEAAETLEQVDAVA